MSIIKNLISVGIVICMFYFTSIGKVGNEYMVLLKRIPSFQGTFFSINSRGLNLWSAMALKNQFRNKYSKIIIIFGSKKMVFMENIR